MTRGGARVDARDEVRTAALWELYRSIRPGGGFLAPVAGTVVAARMDGLEPVFRAAGGTPSAEAHSGRSAWVHRPWSDDRASYPGIEYKGVGWGDGGAVEVVDTGAYEQLSGGQRYDWAAEEYHTSVKAWALGIPCQQPLGLFRLELRDVAVPAGLLARTYTCPLRLIDLWREPHVLETYCDLTGEAVEEYAARLGAVLGRSVRALVDAGMAKPVTIDNTTVDGEIVDFEHVWNGWFTGQPMPPSYAVEAVGALLRELPFALRDATAAFEPAFASAFAGVTPATGAWDERAHAYVEAALGRTVSEEDALAPVADGVRVEMLERWAATLAGYLDVRDALRAAGGSGPTTAAAADVDALIAITRDQITRMRTRAPKTTT